MSPSPPAEPSTAPASPPTQVGRYRIVGRLGAGGMATVYDGYDPGVNRYAAVKVLHAGFVSRPEIVEVFLQEARKLARLERHDGILTVYEVGEHAGAPFIAMQKIDGAPLDALLQRHAGVLPCATVRQVFATVGGALAFAHEHGIVHCDIKPSNILVDRLGHAFLTDFGISRACPDRLGVRSRGLTACTPRYASPEQLDGCDTDARSDIYSLGVVLYEMCTGATPHGDCDDLQDLIAAIHEDTPCPPSRLNPHVPEVLDRVLLRALAAERRDRYASAAEFVRDVLAATDDERVDEAASFGPWNGAGRRRSGRRSLLWMTLAAAALGAGVGAVPRPRTSRPPVPTPSIPTSSGANDLADRTRPQASLRHEQPSLQDLTSRVGWVAQAVRATLGTYAGQRSPARSGKSTLPTSAQDAAGDRPHGREPFEAETDPGHQNGRVAERADALHLPTAPVVAPDAPTTRPHPPLADAESKAGAWEAYVLRATRQPWRALIADYLQAAADEPARAASKPREIAPTPPAAPAEAPGFAEIQRRARALAEQARHGRRH